MARITNDQITTVIEELNQHDTTLQYSVRMSSYGKLQIYVNDTYVSSHDTKSEVYTALCVINQLKHAEHNIKYARDHSS